MPAGRPADPRRVALDQLAPIAGFDTRTEAEALWDLAKGRRVLEIGTYLGFSAILFALAGAESVDTIDPHQGGPGLPVQDTLQPAWHNVRHYGVQNTVRLHVGTAAAVLPMLRECWFDLAFIDGDHEDAAADVDRVLDRMLGDGVIALHDAGRWPQVAEAADYLAARGYTVAAAADSLLVARRV